MKKVTFLQFGDGSKTLSFKLKIMIVAIASFLIALVLWGFTSLNGAFQQSLDIKYFLVFNDNAQVIEATVIENLGDSLVVVDFKGINVLAISGTKQGPVSLKRHLGNSSATISASKYVNGLGSVEKTVYFKEE